MKMTIPAILAIFLIGCAGTHQDQGMEADHGQGMNTEVANPEKLIISDFSKESQMRGWEVEDDVVMGGRSQGEFSINQEGYAVFSGDVSLENSGGFSSVNPFGVGWG